MKSETCYRVLRDETLKSNQLGLAAYGFIDPEYTIDKGRLPDA